MSSKNLKDEAVAFFSEAINKWNRLIELYNIVRTTTHVLSREAEANEILIWFQENYDRYASYSDFQMTETLPDGRDVKRDPVFDVLFQGANIKNIARDPSHFAPELNIGLAALRGHLASIRRKKGLVNQLEIPILRLEKTLMRFHLVANQLRERRRNKTPYLIEDEYDVQDLLRAILKLDFDDIRSEEWTPSYVGGASKIDIVLKKERVLVEVKKASDSLREKQIGSQLVEDIAKYEKYPDVDTFYCFIYDPQAYLGNPKGLQDDRENADCEAPNQSHYLSTKPVEYSVPKSLTALSCNGFN